jgi:hypothetical protein
MTDMSNPTLPPLPQKRRGAFCTKCHNSFTPSTRDEHPVCDRCGYLAFAQDCDYSDDEMRAYARDAFIAGYAAAEADAKVCQVPPLGWRCTRDAGHDGPCAAVEAPEDVEFVERGMARLRERAA